MNEELFEKIAEDAYADEMDKIALSFKDAYKATKGGLGKAKGAVGKFYSNAMSDVARSKHIPGNLKLALTKGKYNKKEVIDNALKFARGAGIVGGTGLVGAGAIGAGGYYGGKAALNTEAGAPTKAALIKAYADTKTYAAQTGDSVKNLFNRNK